MAFQQGLVQKLSTGLAMTPQLQQAIRLLQLSTVELEQEIQKSVEENPLLEIDEGEIENKEKDSNTENINSLEKTASTNEEDLSLGLKDSVTALESNDIPSDNDAPLDTTWENTWDEGITPVQRTPSSLVTPDGDFDFQGETEETLKDHLLWQMNLSHFSATDSAIARAVIDAINDNGYLTESIESIIDAAKNVILEDIIVSENLDYDEIDIQKELSKIDIEEDEVKVVIKRIQRFDPVGVAAFNMQESLKIQLEQLHSDHKYYKKALELIVSHIDLLGSKDFRTLMRKLSIKDDELKSILKLLKQLDPNPGSSYFHDDSQYVKPDVVVKKINNEWIVELNPDSTPRLKVNQTYASLNTNTSSDDSSYIKSRLNEAKWLIKSLETRNETLLKVSRCIVSYQKDFLEHGMEKMRPLILSEVASEVDMHESTISRVTTQKYMHTPRGIYELKFFFSSHVGTDLGGECSSTAVQAKIKKLIASENPRKPLSDNAIAEILTRDGIIVARRTVAKYREAINIPASSLRKQLV